MHRYTVTARSAEIRSGVIQLTPGQADARAHLLSQADQKDCYVILKPIQFKCGEEFGLVIPLPRPEVMGLESLDGEEDTPPPPPPSNPATPPTDEKSLTVKALAEQLSLTIADTIELLKDYQVTAKDGKTVIAEDVYQTVLTDKQAEE
jgi:hypothetical protein